MFCRSCGTALRGQNRFCVSCGSPRIHAQENTPLKEEQGARSTLRIVRWVCGFIALGGIALIYTGINLNTSALMPEVTRVQELRPESVEPKVFVKHEISEDFSVGYWS